MADWGFWAAAFGITVGVFWLISTALRSTTAAPDNPSLRVYRDQLAEVDRDLARGVISASESARIKTEVSRRVLDADRNPGVLVQGSAAQAKLASVAVGAALMAAVAGYYWLGAPGYPDLPLAKRLELAQAAHDNRPAQAVAEANTAAPAPTNADAEYIDLMAKLRAAVIKRPDDLQGLALLARNELGLGNAVAARVAQQQLVTLKATNATAEDHAALAQMMIVAAGGYVSPEAEAQLIRTLALDPGNGLARYFSGVMFAQTGRPDRSFALWQPLLAQGPADAPWIAPIRAQIEQIAGEAGVRYALPALAGPDAATIAAADGLSETDRQAMIAGMVDQLSSRLQEGGGPVDDWIKLINSRMVLQQPDRAQAAVISAKAAFEGNSAALAAINAAATQAGLAP